MAEHYRTFDDPVIDHEHSEPVLHPENDATHRFLLRHGRAMMEKLGGELVTSDFDAEHWRFNTGSTPAAMDIREPDVVIPALLRYQDVGWFYTYTGHDEALWTPNTELTEVPTAVDSGNPTTDSLVVLTEALHQATKVPRALGYAAARLAAPYRDWKAIRQWTMDTNRTRGEIWAHYDLSQDVYVGEHGFLDRRFVQYSSGLLLPGREFVSLEDLQEHKLASLARKLELDTADSGLEIGSGWGGAVTEMARRSDAKFTTLTVSEEQHKLASQRIEANGMADQVKCVLQDYREFEFDQPFDRVFSMEMIEAVDWRDLDEYLNALVKFAHPEKGVIVLQSINIDPRAYARQRHNKSFANTAIFPGGILTPKAEINSRMAERGWPIHEETSLTSSYALTLREWIRNLYENKPALTQKWREEGVSTEDIERFYRGFSFYLALSQAGFRKETEHVEDWQLTYRPV